MRRNLWEPPERTLLSRQRTISNYADPNHVMGHATAEQLRQSADHFSNGGPAPAEIMTHRELQLPPQYELPAESRVVELSSDQQPKHPWQLYTPFDESSVSRVTEARLPDATSPTGSYEQSHSQQHDSNSALNFGGGRSGDDAFDAALAQALKLSQEEEYARQRTLLGNDDDELQLVRALKISYEEEKTRQLELEQAMKAPLASKGLTPREQRLTASPEPDDALQFHQQHHESSAYIATASRTPQTQRKQDMEPRLERDEDTTKRTTTQDTDSSPKTRPSATDTIGTLDEPEEWHNTEEWPIESVR